MMEFLHSFKLNSSLLKAMKVCNVNTRTAVDLAYTTYGRGPGHIIILHGLLGSKEHWKTMSEKIANTTGSIVIAADLRNHGQSPRTISHTYTELASDVSQLINKLAIPEATIIGHSMGGRTAMVLALTEPAKVKKLVVVDISPVSTLGLPNNFFPALIDIVKTVYVNCRPSKVEAKDAGKEKMKGATVTDDVVSVGFSLMNVGSGLVNEMGWMCNVEVLKSHFGNIASFPTDTLVGKQYTGPTLFIAGQRSNFLPPSDIAGIQTYFPAARLIFIPNVGHNMHLEDPDKFHSVVSKFLAESY